MEFIQQNANWLILGGIAVILFAITRLTKPREDTGNSVLSQVFANNQEFDTTIGMIGMFLVLFVMLVYFGDDLKDDIPLVFLMAFQALRDIVTGKKGNGTTEKS